MSKVSENVSEKLETTMQEILEQLEPEHQEVKSKRKRRTKAEMQAIRETKVKEEKKDNTLKCKGKSHIIATVEWDKDKEDKSVLPEKVEIPDSILIDDYNIDTISDWLSDTVGYCHKEFVLSWPDHHETFDEFCQWEIEKAHLENKTDSDFDFRNFYETGDSVYLVRYYDRLNTKELIYMKLRTIYPRAMVGVIEKQCCQCVGISDRDNIFYHKQDAVNFFDSIQANTSDEYEETGKKKRKRKKAVEEDKDITDPESYDDESEDEDDE